MSKIEWTDKTINPIVGCTKISEGCQNCYAEVMAKRLTSMEQTKGMYAGVVDQNGWTGNINFDPAVMVKVLKNKKPTRYFVGSMTDIFHEKVKDEWLDYIFAVIMAAPWHTFFILTKRPERMKSYFLKEEANEKVLEKSKEIALDLISKGIQQPNFKQEGSNLWLGVTAENQEMADQRIPILLDTPAAHRFVSVEPMLGAVWLENFFPQIVQEDNEGYVEVATIGLDWVICGGESGRNPRPIDPEWVLDLRYQCADAYVPFFFKQWGGKNKVKSGRLIDGVEVMNFPSENWRNEK